MHFRAKNTLKNNRYYTSKQPLCQRPFLGVCLIYLPAQLVLKFIYPLDFWICCIPVFGYLLLSVNQRWLISLNALIDFVEKKIQTLCWCAFVNFFAASLRPIDLHDLLEIVGRSF
jgi:hypothetical protein